MNTFTTLLKREFWEHKGGMFWAPLVVGSIMALFATGSVIFGLATAREHMEVNGFPLSRHVGEIPPDTLAEVARAVSFTYVPTLIPFAMVLIFVVLFYSLGSLYDDRRDRSVLFWKSMPVSDTTTVLSKLASILLVAPTVSALMGLFFGLGFIALLLTASAIIGANFFGAVLGSAEFYTTPLAVLAVLPVYILWALPSVAWFMAVSAWAKRAPFLWAVGIPVLGAAILSWSEAMFEAGLPHEWVWENVIARLFGSIVPGLWFAFSGKWELADDFNPGRDSVFQLVHASYASLTAPSLWIGLGIAGVLIAAAIRLRRWREDAA